MKGRALFCCRCRLWCYDKDDLEDLDDDELERLGVLLPETKPYENKDSIGERKEQFHEYLWDASKEYTNQNMSANIDMLTLKALTVLPIASFIGALFFVPFYYGSASYGKLVEGFVPALNWNILSFDFPTFSFKFKFDVDFFFKWPTELDLNFQMPMIMSIGLFVYDLSSQLVWWLFFITKKKKCCKDKKGKNRITMWHFNLGRWIVHVPLTIGREAFRFCEYLWLRLLAVLIVVAFSLYGMFLAAALPLLYSCLPIMFLFQYKKEDRLVRVWWYLFNSLLFVDETSGKPFSNHVIFGARAAFVSQYGTTWLVKNAFRRCLLKNNRMSAALTLSLTTKSTEDNFYADWVIEIIKGNLKGVKDEILTYNGTTKAITTRYGLLAGTDDTSIYVLQTRVELDASTVLQWVKNNEENPALKDIKINSNLGDSGAKEIAKLIGNKKSKQVTHINLEKTGIGKDGAIAIGKALEKNTTLTILNLTENKNITDEGYKAIGQGLQANKKSKLKELNMPKFDWKADADDKEWEPNVKKDKKYVLTNNDMLLVKALLSKMKGKGLKTLRLINLEELNVLENTFGEEGAKALEPYSDILGTSLGWKAGKTEWDISDKGLTDASMPLIELFLNKSTELETLNMSKNKIGDEGMKTLFNVGPKMKKLKVLNLDTNKIGDQGMETLSKVLPEMKGLTNLGVLGNSFGEKGVKVLEPYWKSIATSLGWNAGKTEWDISDKGLTDAWMPLIKLLLSKSTELETLNMSKNKIGDKGMKILSDILPKMEEKMTNLGVLENSFGEEGAEALEPYSDIIGTSLGWKAGKTEWDISGK
eukprot:g2274.t1